MTLPNFRCPKCHAELVAGRQASGTVSCTRCATRIPIRDGVPSFLSPKENDGGVLCKGFAESTFTTPSAYRLVVTMKRFAFKDAALDISAYIQGRCVLDVGCGPSLNLPHMENCHTEAIAYVGIDTSLAFVLHAQRENPSDRYRFAQASITDLPFPDKSFDTAVVSFTIHHVHDPERTAMPELIRVTRNTIIIYDHLRSSNPVIGRLQSFYWRIFDGGCNYMRWNEWESYLGGTTLRRKLQTGPFGQVIKLVCTVN
jgi:SAM-dependent methyltransferase